MVRSFLGYRLVDYLKHKRNRIGPRYSSSQPRTFPRCITSTLPSQTKVLVAFLVGCMKSLQSIHDGITPRFESLRGISLGQQVFPTCRSWSVVSISCLSVSSDTSRVKYFDFASSNFRSLDPLGVPIDIVMSSDATKNSFRILQLPVSNNTPSSWSNRFFI
jgi:hypothetical protein